MANQKKKKKRKSSFQRRQNRLGYLFMAPWIIGFIVFAFIPFFMTFYLSFTDVKQDINGFNIMARIKDMITIITVYGIIIAREEPKFMEKSGLTKNASL